MKAMIPSVAIPTAETVSCQGSPEPVVDGTDFVATLLQVVAEATTAGAVATDALVTATTDSAPADAGPAPTTASAASVFDADRGPAAATDPAMLCAPLRPIALDPTRVSPGEHPTGGSHSPSVVSRSSSLESRRAVPQTSLPVPADGSGATHAIGAGGEDGSRFADTVGREPGADPPVADSMTRWPGGTVDLVSLGLRAALESTPRRSMPALPSPVGTAQWTQEFAERVCWFVDRGAQHASIRLSPEQLGPVEVRMAIREGEASVWFAAAHPDTRAAIEQALPRLREMLAEMGLTLADAGVFHQAPPDPQRSALRVDAREEAEDGARETAVESAIRRGGSGLIDDYA